MIPPIPNALIHVSTSVKLALEITLVQSLCRMTRTLSWETIVTKASTVDFSDIFGVNKLRGRFFSFTGPGMRKVAASDGIGLANGASDMGSILQK